ncbi:MAG: MFS transporter [Spirochaetes bacterium]|nr:MFS transporter [Spirochaetota bacterium]
MHADPRLNKRWDLVVIGIVVNACLGTVYSWSVFREPLEAALGITAAQSGLPYSVFLGAFAFSMPLAGAFIARIGPRVTLLAGGVLLAAGWMSAGFVDGFIPLVVTYGIVGGAGVGFAYGVPLSVVATWFPDKRGLAMGLTLAGFGVSPFVTAPLAEILINRFGVQTAMIVLGVGFIGVIAGLAGFFRRGPEVASASDPEKAEAVPEVSVPPRELAPREMLATRGFYGLWICYAIGTLAGLTAIGMTAPFGRQVAGLSASGAAAAVSAFGILNGVGRPIFGAVHDALGSRTTVVLSYGLIAIGAGVSLLAGPRAPLPFFIGFGIFWLMLGGWLAIAPAATTRLFGPFHYARNYGIMYTAYGVGALVGGSAFSALYSRFNSYSPMFVFVIGLSAVGVVVALMMLRPVTGPRRT